MLISEYLQMRNVASAVTTGGAAEYEKNRPQNAKGQDIQNSPFAMELLRQLETSTAHEVREVNAEELAQQSAVQFSKHAIERINERRIDIYSDDRLDRLNRAVELAGEKGSNDALVFIDSAAFLVSVKNNKVITTVTADDMQGSIFTNIDSTVVM